MPTLLATEFENLQLHARGKVRDLYEVGDLLLMVATDRISAFDHVLATGIPGKGRVLTQISLFWFELLQDIVPNHLVTADVARYPVELQAYSEELRETLDAGESRPHVSRGMCCTRLPFRFRMERLPALRKDLWHRVACWVARVRAVAGANIYPRHKKHER